jgi:hypothetical protein
MPNWADQEFAITGPAEDIDRFCALAVTGNFRRDHTLDDEPTFLFSKVCPIRPSDRRACADEHVDGVLFRFARTQVQAHFNIQTSWDLPRHFYLQRLLRDWPRLSFCCAINEDMNNFGGVLAGFDGIAVDAVEDYAVPYDRKAHAKRVRPLTARWDRLLRADRLWMAIRPLEYRRLAIYKAPATFDDMAWRFFFTAEEDCRRFAKRYKGTTIHRLAGRSWKAVRLTKTGPGRKGK